MEIDIEELIVTGDTVVARATFCRTETGGSTGLSPTGRTVDEWVVTIMQFGAHQVVTEWIGADKLALFIHSGSSRAHGPSSCSPLEPRCGSATLLQNVGSSGAVRKGANLPPAPPGNTRRKNEAVR
jgi:hypothetical protein